MRHEVWRCISWTLLPTASHFPRTMVAAASSDSTLGRCLPTMGTPICSRARDPPRSQTGCLGSDSAPDQAEAHQILPLPHPRALSTRLAPGSTPGGRGRAVTHTHHVHPCADTRADVFTCGCGAHRRWEGWEGGGPSAPRPAMQMAPFTKLLFPAPLPEPEAQISRLLSQNWWAGGGPGRATPAPVQLWWGGVRVGTRCHRAGPWAGCCLLPPGLCTVCSCSLGALPPRRRWLTPAPSDVSATVPLSLLGQGSKSPNAPM